jgi:hypothetical protein
LRGVAEEWFPVSFEPDHKDPDLRSLLYALTHLYLGYASFTPPSTLRTLPVLLDERASEAK